MRARILLIASMTGVAASMAFANEHMDDRRSSSARSDYLEYCAGCHGVTGSSAPARLPELRNRVGYFLCTSEGRRYLARLPNVVRAPVADRRALADLLNYLVFEIGGSSAPKAAAPYRAEEVEDYVRAPLDKASLVKERSRIVEDVLRRCRSIPATLRQFSSTSDPKA